MNKIDPAKCPFFLSAYANAEPPIIFGNTTLESPELFFLRELLPEEFLLSLIPHPIDQN